MSSLRTFNRRALLGGGAAVIGTPFFESLGLRPARAAGTLKRFLAYYHPNGIYDRANEWTPTQTGASYQMTTTLGGGGLYSGIKNIRAKTLVVSGLDREYCHNEPGAHHSGGGAVLTCRVVAKDMGNGQVRAGTSVDQLIAQRLAGSARIPSLQLGMVPSSTASGDSPYGAAYSGCISWANDTTPMPVTASPAAVFDRLFAGANPDESAALAERRRKIRASILDYARQDAARLQAKLNAPDRAKLDQYLTGVRDLENRLAATPGGGTAPATTCAAPTRPGNLGTTSQIEQIKLFADLIVLAFQCNATPVVSFMLGHAKSYENYPELGIPEDHHGTLSHLFASSGAAQASNKAKLLKLEAWSLSQFAYICEKLDALPEGDGTTVLDNTAAFFSSEVGHGENHSQVNMPMLLVGGGAVWKTGRHVRFPNRPMNDIYVSMLNAYGVGATTFGEPGRGTGQAIDLTA